MMDKTQEIVLFAQDKINELYDEYRGASPGEYDEQTVAGMIAITKHMLDTAVKIEALDKLTHLNFADRHGDTDTEAIVAVYRSILDYKS